MSPGSAENGAAAGPRCFSETRGAFLVSGRLLFAHFTRYIPGILINWLMVEGAAGFLSPDTGPVAAAGLFCFTSACYPAAAANASGRWENGPLALALERVSGHGPTLVLYCLVVVTLFSAVLIAGALGGAWSRESGSALVFFCCCAPAALVSARVWPVYVTFFLYGGYSSWSASARGPIWSGPSFITAWRMTGKKGTLAQFTLPLAAAAALLAGAPLYAAHRFSGSAPAVWSCHAFFYGLGLPYLSTLAYTCGEKLRIPVREDA